MCFMSLQLRNSRMDSRSLCNKIQKYIINLIWTEIYMECILRLRFYIGARLYFSRFFGDIGSENESCLTSNLYFSTPYSITFQPMSYLPYFVKYRLRPSIVHI